MPVSPSLTSPPVGATLGLLVVLAQSLSGQAINTDAQGNALYGYDVVAYQTLERATMGSPDFTLTHDGVVYQFASAEHRALFQEDPARYLPAYGGYCAYGVANGYKVKVDPDAFTVVEGRLYINYSQSIKKRWLKDPAGYVERADRNWTTLVDAPRKD